MTGPEEQGTAEEVDLDLKGLFREVVSDTTSYAEVRRAELMLDLGERSGRAIGSMVWWVGCTLLISVVLGMLGLALALYLGRLMQDNVLGFLATAGIFLVLTGVFFLIWRFFLNDRITLAVINSFQGNDPEQIP